MDAKLFDFIVRQDLAVSTSLFDLKLRVHVLVDVSQPFDAAHKAVRGWSETTWGNVKLGGWRRSREEAPIFEICAACELERPKKNSSQM